MGLKCRIRRETKGDKTFTTALALESTIKNEFDENPRIEIRYFLTTELND